MSEEIKETKGGELTQGEFKVKKQVKKLIKKDTPIKIDLKKQEPEAIKEDHKKEDVIKVDLKKEETEKPNIEIQEIIEDKTTEKEPAEDKVIEKTEVIKDTKEEKPARRIVELPEDLNKLVKFMEETGGGIKDYVRLSTNYEDVDDNTLLKEYYKSTKPHLNNEEIDFIMDDNFSFDEELEEERDIRKKKLAFKEEIANAKNFLETTKEKYYEEIKLRPKVTQEQQKAMDFFNRYNTDNEASQTQQQEFNKLTDDYFSNDFKGFEFNVGEKKFKYNVNNAQQLAKDQTQLYNFTETFSNEDGTIIDHKGYHKALYAAKNADTIAKHFYEQGKSDGIKNIVNKSKNIETASRPQSNGDIFIGGLKVKAISGGVDSSKLKIQTTKNKN
tara:strand:- start:688 stop:1845 length:1158 start_codon:yes stop_codon:yes gene_type:complete